eukprot:TRINITY_DN14559_c0_g1_i1.p1 TRINITY_DN14559_c0_g1~~TRINITY_DN14559_c0_g1_i1.p1  ORF type:complete len:173 (+),score=3.71 TRINITY_DN14559_c0_g1_i1:114-632(+)
MDKMSEIPWDRFLAKSKIPQGHTDELLTWISKVNQKRNFAKSGKLRDYRKEAMLENALISARNSLQIKQQERRQRWANLKLSLEAESNSQDLCDCEACFLCTRHKAQTRGNCYCNILFNPCLTSTELIGAESACEKDEDSQNVDIFLASLSSNKSKRKADFDYSITRKRCKA